MENVEQGFLSKPLLFDQLLDENHFVTCLLAFSAKVLTSSSERARS